MTRVELVVVTMEGNEYVLYERDGAPAFPSGELADAESPADGARRVVAEWTGTKSPKLELVDLRASPGALTLLMRAMLVEPPQGDAKRAPRMGLPERVGAFAGSEIEESLKTSLNYKLTRG